MKPPTDFGKHIPVVKTTGKKHGTTKLVEIKRRIL
jgi:hypothetical protein